eukprot:273604-Amphidinium_carterae.1
MPDDRDPMHRAAALSDALQSARWEIVDSELFSIEFPEQHPRLFTRPFQAAFWQEFSSYTREVQETKGYSETLGSDLVPKSRVDL